MDNTRTHEEDKQALITVFNHLHSMVIDYLKNLNIDPMLRIHCFQNMDQGAYWAREAIKHIPAPTAPALQEVKSIEEKKEAV